MKQAILFVLGIHFLCSCSLNKEEENAVARVGDSYLYEEDLAALNFDDLDRDSLEVKKSFIDNWVKERLLLKKALQNLNEQQVDFEEQLENYKNSLLIFKYENQLIRQKMDTSVSKEEIDAYYQQNQQNFDLKTPVLEARFIKIINSAPAKDSMQYWLFSRKNEFQEKLSGYCTQFATNCQIDSLVWTPLPDLMSILPAALNADEVELKKGENIFADSTETLLVDLFNRREAGSPAPIYLVKNRIKVIIRNRRKIQLLSKVKAEIFEDATLKKEYEIYN